MLNLFMERKNGGRQLSLGRLFFWFMTLPAIWALIPTEWAGGYVDVGSNHMILIGFALCYNLGKKGVKMWSIVNGKDVDPKLLDGIEAS